MNGEGKSDVTSSGDDALLIKAVSKGRQKGL